MKLIILLLIFSSFSLKAELTLKDVEVDIFKEGKLKKDDVMSLLLSGSHEDKNLSNYLLSLVYGYGLYGVEKNIEKSEYYFLPLLELKYRDIFFVAGTFWSNSRNPEKFKRGVILLEKASEEGDLDALYNLYSLYNHGRYTNKDKLGDILGRNYDKGDKEIALQYGKVMIDGLIEKQDKLGMLKVLDNLSRISFKGYEGEYYYVLAGFYGYTNSPLYDEEKRNYYLIRSYENGYYAAEKLLKGMGMLPDLPIEK
ncbi:hypothetical protein [Pseudoalteromonas sp. R3]|uniref:hypothetical protein n=1 Tax=Pseudoalteromonas sp. R3 TaxID=1709477 RepID=UPI0006B41B66|nr:hypothetical protein [Pseudoalteromonas sp. R3]AZZ96408.1 hypothetical protein ELR70_04280 [Pseudoalteromonas sp. R3]